MRRVSLEEAKKRIYRYCAYQERSHKQVKARLYSFGVSTSSVDEILVELITAGFLNEERFARAFAGGKFRLKKWGRLKIMRELESHDINRNCIKLGLQEIETEDYKQCLRHLLEKKLSLLNTSNVYIKRDKAARYALAKGFEPELVWSELRVLSPD